MAGRSYSAICCQLKVQDGRESGEYHVNNAYPKQFKHGDDWAQDSLSVITGVCNIEASARRKCFSFSPDSNPSVGKNIFKTNKTETTSQYHDHSHKMFRFDIALSLAKVGRSVGWFECYFEIVMYKWPRLSKGTDYSEKKYYVRNSFWDVLKNYFRGLSELVIHISCGCC